MSRRLKMASDASVVAATLGRYSEHGTKHTYSENYAQSTDQPAMTPSTPTTRQAILADFESLMRHVAQRHAPEFLEIDVTMSQIKVLYMASVRPDTNMSMVAAQLHVGLSAVSGLVDRLVEHGLLTRHEDPVDRRQHLLNVSPKGARVLERVRELNTAHLERLLSGLSERELDALHDGIAALEREAHKLDERSDDTDADHERTSA